MFFATFSSSVFSATLGIAKYLKDGPCRLVSDEGFLGGHANIGFILLLVNIASIIVGKCLVLYAITQNGAISPNFTVSYTIVLWVAICYFLPLIYVIILNSDKLINFFILDVPLSIVGISCNIC